MKRILILTLLFACCCRVAQAQSRLSPTAKLFWHAYSLQEKQLNKSNRLDISFYERFGIYDRKGIPCAGVLAITNGSSLPEYEFNQRGIHIRSRFGNVITLSVPVQQFGYLLRQESLSYIETGSISEPDLNKSLVSTNVKKVHEGLGGLHKKYTGKGVVVAVIDWGFDYTHPMFYDTSLTGYRIVRAWDQNKTSGPHPPGFDFGTEYRTQSELLAAKEDTLYPVRTGSHGTHVAGIAAGAGAGIAYKGMAPEAELICISYRRDPYSFAEAVRYVSEYADSVGKPFVINMSFGNHNGPHDGTLPENLVMDEVSGRGKVFVASAGNNGDAGFHLRHLFSDSTDTLKTVIGFQSVANYFGQAVSMWGAPLSSFSVKLKVAGTSNQDLFETPYYHTAFDSVRIDTFVFGSDSLIVRVVGTAQSPLNQKPSMRLEIRKVTSGKIVLQMHSSGGEVHLWNVISLNNRITNWGVAFSNTYPGAVSGNTAYGLGEPGGVGKSTITVASHVNDVTNSQDSILSYGPLSAFSSRGPTVDGRMKPDISGPGQNITSSVSTFDPNFSSALIQVSFQGRNYPFAPLSGTSMSSPTVAGIVALLLQANPNLKADEIKYILQQTVRLDSQTGTIDSLGSTAWGRGKVNALAALLMAEVFTSEPTIIRDNYTSVQIFPNPAHSLLNISGNPTQLKLFDLEGRLVFEEVNPKHPVVMATNHLPNGVYLLMIQSASAWECKKVVIQHP